MFETVTKKDILLNKFSLLASVSILFLHLLINNALGRALRSIVRAMERKLTKRQCLTVAVYIRPIFSVSFNSHFPALEFLLNAVAPPTMSTYMVLIPNGSVKVGCAVPCNCAIWIKCDPSVVPRICAGRQFVAADKRFGIRASLTRW